MNNARAKGIMFGAFGAVCYGMNPLFALPMFAHGIGVNSVLFYRYFFAILIFGFWTVFVKRISLKISLKEAGALIPLGFVFSLSSLTLFMSYNYIDAGIASTILFMYPILVAVIMAAIFQEKLSLSTIMAIIMTTFGILLFYKGESGMNLNLLGLFLVILSSLSYAVYIVGVNKIPVLKDINPSKLTFYVMFFGLLVFVANFEFSAPLQRLSSPFLFICAIALSIFPTIVSLETMTLSIKMIGPTLAAILGALEPVTAIFFGVLVFHEHLTFRIILGIILILAAVFLIVFEKKKS